MMDVERGKTGKGKGKQDYCHLTVTFDVPSRFEFLPEFLHQAKIEIF